MTEDTRGYVLDSFALLAYFEDELGAETVEHLLRQAQEQTMTLYLSLLNLGEVYYITQREREAKTKPSKPWRFSTGSLFTNNPSIVRSC